MAIFTQVDITNPMQKMVLAGPKSSYGYIFRDSYVVPEVGDTIMIWNEKRTIMRIERPNEPGKQGAIVRAI